MAQLKRFVIHPFLWAVFPILMLVAYNVQTIALWTVYRSIIVSLVGTTILFGILWLVLRDSYKAGLLVTLCLALFFTYGQIIVAILNKEIFGFNVGRHGVIAPLWLIIFVVSSIVILRAKRTLTNLTQALNLMATVALILPLVQIGLYRLHHFVPTQASTNQAASIAPIPSELESSRLRVDSKSPDVYYIILDGYGGDDTLSNYFDYDNTGFLNGLKKLGFYIASCSQSNYSVTRLSLPSSLNMRYLDTIGVREKDTIDPSILYPLLEENETRAVFKRLGYQIVSIESGYEPTDWENADFYLSKDTDQGKVDFLGRLNQFESMELRTTAGLLLYKGNIKLPASVRTFLDSQYTESRARILYAFDAIGKIPTLPGHKFIFIHILAPHAPFTFGPNGEILNHQTAWALSDDLDYIDAASYKKGYRDEINYLNGRVLSTIKKVIDDSAVPPVIIIQGDHGPQSTIPDSARLAILNVYYFPDNGDKNLYLSISPVNTFRVVFNTYFGAKISLLPDTAHFLTRSGTYQTMPNPRQECQANGTAN